MWYIMQNGQQIGPLEKSELQAYGLTPETYVWKPGMPQWQEAKNFPELMDIIYQTCPPPYIDQTPYDVPVPSNKDRIGCGLLAIFLGGLGIQYFYLGKVTAGILTILLTIITCGIWSLVMFIQGIVMLTMTDEQFDRKFVYSTSTMPIF